MKNLQFIKMHGLGNDYVYLDCIGGPMPKDPVSLARKVSHRNFGVGSDGLVLILPSEEADLAMRIWNADGSEAEMCGNATRCVGKYAYEHGLVKKEKRANWPSKVFFFSLLFCIFPGILASI